MSEDLRFPIGKWQRPTTVSEADRAQWIDELAAAPAGVRRAVEGLSEAQLDTPHRDGGWTVRQTVHHLADSHLNAYTRFKLALTEDNPTIKPYDQTKWAELDDAKTAPVGTSLAMLESMHARLVMLLRSMAPQDFERSFTHPETKRTVPLGEMLSTYAWHGKHHTAHITKLRERKGWTIMSK